MKNANTRKWFFGPPAWFDHVAEDLSSDYENVWWDPARKRWKQRGTTRLTLSERNQAYHGTRFAQWASHKLAETAPRRGWTACRNAVMRLVAAWVDDVNDPCCSELELRILDAWYRGDAISDRELAEEAKSFGYPRIAEILEPLAGDDDGEEVGGIVSMHKRVHW